MSHYIALFLMIMVSSVCGQQSAGVQKTLQNIVNHAESSSLYRDKVDWTSLRPEIYNLAKDAQYVTDLEPALRHMLEALGDEHGRIFHNSQILAYYNSGKLKEHLDTFESEIYNNIQMGQVYQFHAELLEDHIGYVRIVGLPMGDNEKMANKIQKAVCSLVDDGADKWIIDLRYNGGGNMHPMAEGIASIIGSGQVGGSKGLTKEEDANWKIEDNDFYYDDYSIELPDDCGASGHQRVAVLTSLYTASSGEALAVIFKGRANTKFFGQKTLGMVTVTNWEVIDDATAMTISVSYYKDRDGNVYDEYVDVDNPTSFVEEPLSQNDNCLHKAVDWLISK